MIQPYNSYKASTGLLLIFILGSLMSKAQIKPNAQTKAPNAMGTVTTPYNPNPSGYVAGIPVNSIRTWQPQQPLQDEAEVFSNARTVDEVNHSTQYFDGLGRPLQSVVWQNSPGKKDVVAPVTYDDFGREQYKFLPYTSTENNGMFKTSPFTAQNSFYTGTYKTEQAALDNEKYFYSHSQFEASPLNRPTATFAPGNSWAGSEGATAERAVKIEYLINKSSDTVRIWDIGFNSTIADNTNIPTSASGREYAAGELYKTVTKDEHSNAVVEYRDKEGRVVLKKVQIGMTAADYSGYSGFLCTYYVYDDLGQLRTVIQPKVTASMASAKNWVLSQTMVNELCFRYEYDERQRMIAKKIPGAAWAYMVYDNRDRLVFTQDGNMRGKLPGQWMYTLYDDLNRPVQTGIMSYTGTWANLKSGIPINSQPVTASGIYVTINPADLYISSRDYSRGIYEATNSITFDNGFTSEDNASFTAQIVTETANTFSKNDTVNTYLIPLSGATLYPLTYTYYDDYAATTKTYDATNNAMLDNGGNNNAEALPSQSSKQTEGLVTITKVRVIEDPNNLSAGKWLEAVNFYDAKARLIQVQNINYKRGNDVFTNRYDFTGKVVSSYMVHNNASGNISNLRVLTSMNYDHAGRVETVTKTINDDITNNKRTVVSNTYDALGQLKNKKTGQKSATDATAMEDDNYSYNIRGWLKSINWYNGTTYASQESSAANKWFATDLSYDWGFTSANQQFNGNIAGIRWKSAGDETERAFGYKYDAANRILKADFTQYNGSWATDPNIQFNMQVGDGATASSAYDENGNIKFMQQYGLEGVSSKVIDKMTYKYKQTGELSNQLLAVTEDNTIGTSNYQLGDFTDKNRTADDYDYDANGNLTYDKNKKITLIEYNHLNLPWRMTVQNDDGTNKGTIIYVYDVAGNKLEKRTGEIASSYNNNTAKQTITTYTGAFVYENNKLQFFSHEEGRVRYKQIIDANNQPQTSFVFDYFLKDHLGNVRMVLTEEQQTDMYPALSFEGAQGSDEVKGQDAIWDNNTGQAIDVINSRISRPANFGTSTSNGNYVKQITKAGGAIGAAKMLKVMSADKIDVSVDYYYTTNNANNSSASGLNTLLNSIVGMISGSDAAGSLIKADAATVFTNLSASPDVTGFFTPENASTGGINNPPKAYLHVLFFDDRFVFDNANSYVKQVDYNPNARLSITKTDIAVKKNGYAYVYFSNESNDAVYFDNFMLSHKRGPLLEETHYYPFGLTMSGISSSSFQSSSLGCGCSDSKKGFNGNEIQNKEFSDASGLEVYDFNARTYDQQIGRFIQIDPLVFSEDFLEEKEEVNGGAFNLNNLQVYAFAYNNPIRYNDPDGKCPNCVTGAIGAGIGALIGGGFELGKQLWRDGKVTSWRAVGGGAVQGAITGGAAGFTGGASLLTTAAVTGTANVVGGTVNRSIQGQQTTVSNIATDFAVGAVFGAAGKYIGDKASQLITKNNLIKELAGNGIKHTADDIVGIGKNSAGKVIFLETGNAKAGLTHIIGEHGKEFAQAGISQKDLPKFIMQAVLTGKQVGTQGTRPIYEVTFNGVKQRVAVTVGNNGYVVGANIASMPK